MSFAAAQFNGRNRHRTPCWNGEVMIVLGIILLILGFVFSLHILWVLGIILLVIGAVFWIMGSVGRPVAGRRYWF
ncbi:MAG: hypothetical protein J2P16_08860 [Mycobacterium sp.]|nr:hypothetical protein [Mycobacterium sp.]